MSLSSPLPSASPSPPPLLLPKVIVIAGPTGSGKSAVAAQLCAAMRGVVISADSVQAYRALQIGANKPTAAELARTPHILLDVADHTPNSCYNAADWRRDAVYAIRELSPTSLKTSNSCSNTTSGSNHEATNNCIVAGEEGEDDTEKLAPANVERQRAILHTIRQAQRAKTNAVEAHDDKFLPVVVGGTMMYLQWLVHGRPDAVRPTAGALRLAKERITAYEADDSNWDDAAHHVCSQGEAYAQQVGKLSGQDWYRLRRILEVAYTVRPPPGLALENDALVVTTTASTTTTSHHHAPPPPPFSGVREGGLSTLGYDVRCFFLCPDDRMLHGKVLDRRCEDMVRRGLLTETTDLVLAGAMPDMAAKAIGYRQSIEYLERDNPKDGDDTAFDEYVAKFAAATRQYSKKQTQWFRRDTEFVFVAVPLQEATSAADRVNAVARELARFMTLSRDAYDAERLGEDGATATATATASSSSAVRFMNLAQAKGMKVYQLEKQILVAGSPARRDALAEADACTRRFHCSNNKRARRSSENCAGPSS